MVLAPCLLPKGAFKKECLVFVAFERPFSELFWWSDELNKGISIEYPSIALHAVARDTSDFPHVHVYCQISTPGEAPRFLLGSAVGDNPDDSSDYDEEEDFSEFRFVPKEPGCCKLPSFLRLHRCSC